MITVAIRRATRKDARVIAGFAIKLFAQHRQYDSRRFIELINVQGAEEFYANQTEKKDAAVLVAEIDNKIVGFAFVQYEKLNYSGLLENALWLHDIYVDEAARKHTVGKNLIRKAVEIGKEFGADKLMLSAATCNEHAQEFFERTGFRATMIEMMLDLTKENKISS